MCIILNGTQPFVFQLNRKLMKIAIIGAGCSGLSAIKQLTAVGLTDITCFEKTDRLGGNWAYTEKPGYSSLYQATRTISSKAMSQFSDFPMPADYPDYPSHEQILAYFQAYARHFGLEKLIRFNLSVTRADKTLDDRWKLILSDGAEQIYDYLVVANGHLTVPRHPDWKDQFRGTYLHVRDYKTNLGFENKRVLVVGAGNSGCDCAVDISRVAAQVDISLRSPQYIIPKYIMGKPTDTFASGFDWLPQWLQDGIQKMILRSQIGRYQDYQLPEPTFPPRRAHPTLNSELLPHIREGKIKPRNAIARIVDQTVYFSDGSFAQYDIILAATGYQIAFPFFPKGLIDWEASLTTPLYLRMFDPQHNNLAFIGLLQPQGCLWTLTEVQAKLLGLLLTQLIQLPENWRSLALTEGASWSKQFLGRPRHSLEVHPHAYLKQLQHVMVGKSPHSRTATNESAFRS